MGGSFNSNFAANNNAKKMSSDSNKWKCEMCTFENKATAMQCEMCTVDRPAHTLSSGVSATQPMSSAQLKELHKTLTFHYNQYTQLQQLPPDQQQEKHEEMTYHYTQYSVMYKQYQEQQALKKKNKKQKVIKKPKVV